ncbi:MAG TPA: pyridoxamine 5'-phosphate oxidase family protein, partial [Pyrinomonadaceae bacterium]|nr:pyridoxamine 5'-phosphate oxidase family protein [Pyrinomonadaceae bacterium]
MTGVYHPGELAVQRRVGVPVEAARVGGIIRREMPQAAMAFLREQQLAVLGSRDTDGQVWATLLTGPPGFMRAVDERTLRVETFHSAGSDLLLDNLKQQREVGILAIEFHTRRRMRLNGRAVVTDAGVIHVRSEQVYSNCPKYIHEREVVAVGQTVVDAPAVRRLPRLTDEHRRLISASDTFFIATFHAEGGADASHRGGDPGFVRADADGTILWPDYQGNSMFNTLGNLYAHPPAGLLFVNFDEGHTL